MTTAQRMSVRATGTDMANERRQKEEVVDMPWWGWIVFGAALLVVEVLVTTDFFLIFFGATGVLIGLLLLAGWVPPVWAQWLLFALISSVTLVFFRRRMRRAFDPGEVSMDEIVGEVLIATEAVAAGGSGHAELRGSVWRVANVGNADIQAGNECRITHKSGVVLHIEAV